MAPAITHINLANIRPRFKGLIIGITDMKHAVRIKDTKPQSKQFWRWPEVAILVGIFTFWQQTLWVRVHFPSGGMTLACPYYNFCRIFCSYGDQKIRQKIILTSY